jgi:hypothetical protein
MDNVPRPRHSYFWSDEQLAFVREHVSDMPLEEIGKTLGKSRKAVLHQVYKLGLSYPRFFDDLEPEILGDGTALIPLVGKKGKGKHVRVSQDRLPALQGRRIFLVAGYPSFNQDGKHVYLHLFLRPNTAAEVDHRDGNRLNATDGNLRAATRQQNVHNTKAKGGSSSFKGVDWRKEKKKWRVRIKMGDVVHFLGHFSSELEAARAYNQAALRLHGEFARLNDLEE